MKLVQEHLDRLCCPVCFGVLRLRALPAGEAIDCQACGRRYPVHDGLPVLLADRATRPADGPPDPAQAADPDEDRPPVL